MSYPPFLSISMLPPPPPPPMEAQMHPSTCIPLNHGARNNVTIISQPTVYLHAQEPEPQFRGPIITIFIGNISERISEALLRSIFAKCGVLVNWQRVSVFGYCEFNGPVAAMRAVRLLDGLEIDGKKLKATVDTKNKDLIEKYKEQELQNDKIAGADSLDEKAVDAQALQQMHDLINKHKHEFELCTSLRDDLYSTSNKPKAVRKDHIDFKALQEAALEEDKRKLISTEIDKFRTRAEADEKKQTRKDKKGELECVEKHCGEPQPSSCNKAEKEDKVVDTAKRSEHRNGRSDGSRKHDETRRRSKSRRRTQTRFSQHRQDSRERDHQRPSQHVHHNREEVQRENARRSEEAEMIRKKEESYQKRLSNWEEHERVKAKKDKEYYRAKQLKHEELENNAQLLKEFLHIYDDERHDKLYYTGLELKQRLENRAREVDADAKDRQEEAEQLAKLKRKIYNDNCENPEQVYKAAFKALEAKYMPRVVTINLYENAKSRETPKASGSMTKPCCTDVAQAGTPVQPVEATKPITLTLGKQMKINKTDAFANNDELNNVMPVNTEAVAKEIENPPMFPEENRHTLQAIIANLPTKKDDVFKYKFQRSEIDDILIEQKIRPWINKKIIEYIGEPELELEEYLCSKLLSGSPPEQLVEDLKTFVDDDAEIFIIKLWRLIIMELEAKKIGVRGK